MPLNQEQIAILKQSIENYNFPAVYYNFEEDTPVQAQNMAEVEDVIKDQLTSPKLQDVKHGLANVLHWGYAQIGYGKVRVTNFQNRVTEAQLRAFQELIEKKTATPNLIQIKNLSMPEFSGISFLSKVLAFLNPNQYCVLDLQLARIGIGSESGALGKLPNLTSATTIRVTTNNQTIYDGWRAECQAISSTYFQGKYRVVDIERGFFNLVQEEKLPIAQEIYRAV